MSRFAVLEHTGRIRAGGIREGGDLVDPGGKPPARRFRDRVDDDPSVLGEMTHDGAPVSDQHLDGCLAHAGITHIALQIKDFAATKPRSRHPHAIGHAAGRTLRARPRWQRHQAAAD